jgi:hypothetical protein
MGNIIDWLAKPFYFEADVCEQETLVGKIALFITALWVTFILIPGAFLWFFPWILWNLFI